MKSERRREPRKTRNPSDRRGAQKFRRIINAVHTCVRTRLALRRGVRQSREIGLKLNSRVLFFDEFTTRTVREVVHARAPTVIRIVREILYWSFV